ncbi:MAG: hypothetical protein DRI46_07345 [Chloroflexi bacterium]|nr:MAG: hypothetical protein DRI46_07345 [Chloroflexota bacterium]
MMKSHLKLGLLFTAACLVLIVSACDPIPNCGDPYTVTKTDDTNDGVCSAGDCSLREAVLNANACPGTQIINLPAGSYPLTIDGDDEDLGETGDLDVTDDLIINGSGAPSIHGGIERAFHIHNGVTAEFNAIWVTGGDTILGGGLINEGDLTLNAFTCNYNTVSIPPGGMGDAMGGCIFNTSSLNLDGGQFLNNSAGYGGAIYNLNNATATIENINFYYNEAEFNGGAIWIDADADVNIAWSTFDGNLAGLNGGAVWNHGNFIGENLAFFSNESADSGGAVYSWTDTYTQFTNTRISGNIANAGGGIYNNNGMMHLYESGLSDNTATGPVGGGIYNNGPIPTGGLLLKNVTVSNNTALGGVGGAGVYNTGNFDFRFITISGNNPEGLRIDTGSEIKIRSSILADNPGGDCSGTFPDSLDYNIDSDGSCGLSGPHDLSATDPLLEPLGSFGSMALSHPLGPGSPAIDSGTPDLCIANDQNGVTRPQGARCDRGAFENPVTGGSVSGLVWHDLCAVPYATPPSPPPGCIDLPGGGLGADGIYDPGEPGIEGVRVHLFTGGCPFDPVASSIPALTDSNGQYTISGVAPGTYCTVIYTGEIPNDTILIPGSWTYPPGGSDHIEYEVTLGSGENVTEINFGWDYQFLPEPEAEPTSEPSHKGKLNKNAFCRLGPGTVYDTATAFETGREFEILGRSETHLPLWLYIEELILKMRCWIFSETAEFEWNPEYIPTVIADPTPTPIVCTSTLNKESCEKAGGDWFDGGATAGSYCICPK